MVESPNNRDRAFDLRPRAAELPTELDQTVQPSSAATKERCSIREATVAHFTPATPSEQRTGLLGYLRVRYGDLVLDGLTLRRTAAGRLTVSYPARRDRKGGKHPYFAPADEEKRVEFERWFLEVCKRSGGEL
jgi:hypothetical protein